MSESKLFAQRSEKCRQQARRALSPDEMASWMGLAREWQELADECAGGIGASRAEKDIGVTRGPKA